MDDERAAETATGPASGRTAEHRPEPTAAGGRGEPAAEPVAAESLPTGGLSRRRALGLLGAVT
ncbi:hypothetical protein, partial [Actinomadura logoneensis]|uniref:hypothetical protein n=1 Tax=Actinomadura logoneensis TaxID=2293572 RepID=UPI001A9A6292